MTLDNFRFGYACLNTKLRDQNPPVFTSRTVRLTTFKTKGLSYIKSLAMQNLQDLLTILKWNKKNNIFLMRVSSEIFPFASHPDHKYSINFASNLLAEIGKYARDNGMRLTCHPGQYDILASPNKNVVRNTALDLNHHCDILDKMHMDKDSVIVIHGGGVYGDKPSALARFAKNFKKLPKKTRDRIVLENCEKNYTIEDLLPVCEKLKIPLVIDFHHDSINTSSKSADYYFKRVFAIWKERGIKPKVHVSNSCNGITKNCSATARAKHSDYITVLHKPLLKIKFDIDVMLEAKMKEVALLRLRKIYKM